MTISVVYLALSVVGAVLTPLALFPDALPRARGQPETRPVLGRRHRVAGDRPIIH